MRRLGWLYQKNSKVRTLSRKERNSLKKDCKILLLRLLEMKEGICMETWPRLPSGHIVQDNTLKKWKDSIKNWEFSTQLRLFSTLRKNSITQFAWDIFTICWTMNKEVWSKEDSKKPSWPFIGGIPRINLLFMFF